jgi:hypothetical protein
MERRTIDSGVATGVYEALTKALTLFCQVVSCKLFVLGTTTQMCQVIRLGISRPYRDIMFTPMAQPL